ncbi:MAG: hypothetical protein GY954_12230, partial [Alteromonas sp.]|nr:hypothetical protein [Alteromonas sp.]
EFTNITKFIAGGSAEQADFSGMNTVSISASDYVGFTSFKGKEGAGNTFTATDAVNTWVIKNVTDGDGVNDGTLNGSITFINFANLTGNAQADSFDFSQGGSITGTIDGVGDSNTITGQNVASEWNVNKANEGALYLDNSADGFGTAYVAKFTNIQNVTGGSANDSFVFTGTGALDGELDGGDGTNTLVARDIANAWDINNANQGVLYAGASNSDFIASNQITSFKQIQNITGGSNSDIFIFGTSGSIVGTLDGGNGTNTLVAKNVANEWDINEANEGALYLDNLGAGFENAYVTEFSNIQNLTGNANNDLFVFGTSGAVSGTVDGGDDGSVSINKLIAHGVASEWDISGENAGTLHLDDAGQIDFNGNKLASFTQVQNITGGSADDIFVFGANGKITGQLDGGTGAGDTLIARDGVTNDWVFTTLTSGSVNQTTGDAGNQGIYVTDFVNVNKFTAGSASESADFSSIELALEINVGNYSGFSNFIGNYEKGFESTLIGTDAGNTWELEGVNSGTLNTDTTFSLFANLKGGAGSDTFDFTKGGSVTGSVVGNGTGVTNTVIAADIANEWNITDNGVGTLHKDIDAGTQFEGAVVTQFSDIQNITGAGNTDIFVFGASGAISGTVDGKGGINTLMARDSVENTWAFTDLNSGSVTQVSGAVKYVNEFTNITKFIAGGSAEQADFSGMNTVSISASDYVGFTSFKGKEGAGNT